ncbi:D-3-phosphoglycerate dehydrogenase [Striga asiatica]|uniref:Protein TIC 40, chloroplastic n=1 Tax=Striga asiatica TaxID=4170 RepID=A0A5A7Q0Q4_STRAF|nr:D-3-phosphoglycerate dehydrogenase [Striga asiatica]
MENLGLVSSHRVVLGVYPNPRSSIIPGKPFVGLPRLIRKSGNNGGPKRPGSSFVVLSLFGGSKPTKTIASDDPIKFSLMQKYAMEQAFKTMSQQMNTQNNPFGNAAFSPGSTLFPFPPPATNPPSSDAFKTSTPMTSQAVTVDVPATKVEDPPSIPAKEKVVEPEGPKKSAFVDISPDETLQKNDFENFKESVQKTSQNGTTSNQRTPASKGPSTSEKAPLLSVEALEKMMEDPTVQQMVYPYLPEEMRNPTTFKWMLQNPQYRQQLQDMLNNMGGSPEWDNRMMDSLKNFDLSSPEIKQQFDQIGLTPEEVISKIMANPDVAMAFQNPRVQAAIMDCSQNPLSIAKYQNDKEVRVHQSFSCALMHRAAPLFKLLKHGLDRGGHGGVTFTARRTSIHEILFQSARSQSYCSSVSMRKFQDMTGDSGESITRVLFCGPYFPGSHNFTREYLQSYPFIQVDVVPFDDVPDVIGKYDICIVKNMKLTSDIIARASKMKLIMQFGVGIEGVDLSAASSHEIKVGRIPSHDTGNAHSCAEMSVYLMLGLLRKQNEIQVAVKEKNLGSPMGDTLLGKTIFILGFGNIGIHLAKLLRPFGVKIIATKRSWPSSSPCSGQPNSYIGNGTYDDLVDEKGTHEDILKFASRADIVVCCLTMNSETVGIVNKTFISSMKKGALLINIARGGLLDYEAVLNNLKSGHLGGLGTDVAWIEPFDPNDPILKLPNVIYTNHIAGVTKWAYNVMAKVVGDVALQLHAGTPVKALTGIEIVN